jgi:hypothetical protein
MKSFSGAEKPPVPKTSGNWLESVRTLVKQLKKDKVIGTKQPFPDRPSLALSPDSGLGDGCEFAENLFETGQ